MFYGWWVLAASVVIELFGLGFGIFAITTVYPYVIETFPDWPRHIVFLPTSIVIFTAGALAWVTGVLIDRYPIRRLFVAGIVIQSAALLAFSRVETQAQYLGTAVALGIGLAGVTILPNQVLVSRWFRTRVGLVNGIILGATALDDSFLPSGLYVPDSTQAAQASGAPAVGGKPVIAESIHFRGTTAASSTSSKT